MKTTRKILEINEERCNGCGLCILDCAEHALIIENGKAKIISDALCDGLGACIQGCPQDALTIIEREASPFDEKAVEALQKAHGTLCSGATANKEASFTFSPQTSQTLTSRPQCPSLQITTKPNETHWPIKLRIIPTQSPFLKNKRILLTADCAPAVFKEFHTTFNKHVTITCCPKFETHESISQKLFDILTENTAQSLDVLRMEVPCCTALQNITDQVITHLKKKDFALSLKAKHHTCKRDGTVEQDSIFV